MVKSSTPSTWCFATFEHALQLLQKARPLVDSALAVFVTQTQTQTKAPQQIGSSAELRYQAQQKLQFVPFLFPFP